MNDFRHWLSVLLFWTYFFLLNLLFFLQQLSHYWEILIMLLSQFPFTFLETQKGMPILTTLVTTVVVPYNAEIFTRGNCRGS